MTCADCIHFIYGGHLCRCDARPGHAPGFLNKACEKFLAGDSRKERTDYLAGLAPVTIQHKPERFTPKQVKKHMEEKNIIPAAVKEPAPATKVCKRCGRELPIESFATHPKSKDGHTTICRECFKEACNAGKKPGPKAEKKADPEPANDDNFQPVVKVVRTSQLNPPPRIPEPAAPVTTDIRTTADCLKYANDADLVAELRRRGWEVKETKTTMRRAMSTKDKILAEIERRIEGKSFVRKMELLDLAAWIDSLPDEECEGLEEEIEGMYQALFGTDIINRREMVYLETFEAIARHFAEWGAKHLK